MISVDNLMANNKPTYPEQIAAPFRKELTDNGFQQLLTPEDVDEVIGNNPGKTVLVMMNSVCGCSARSARPGTLLSLFNNVVPDVKATVFAGMEKAAVNAFRTKYLAGITPSSPNIFLFKDGEPVFVLQRYQIEGNNAGGIGDELVNAYNTHCTTANNDADVKDLQNYFIQHYNIDPLNYEEK